MLHRCTACCISVPPIRFVLVGAVLGKAAATAALQIGASVFYRSHRNWCTVHLRKSYICVRPRVCVGRCVWVGLARTRRGAGEAAKGDAARCDLQRHVRTGIASGMPRGVLRRPGSPPRLEAPRPRRRVLVKSLPKPERRLILVASGRRQLGDDKTRAIASGRQH
jgi:hypothetical protein